MLHDMRPPRLRGFTSFTRLAGRAARAARASRRMTLALLAEAALAGTSCSSSAPPAGDVRAPDPRSGVWHVYRNAVRDPDGRAVIMRGVNFCGNHKNAPYFGAQTAADAQKLRKDFGFNGVRFLVTWAAVEPQKGVYDDAYLDALATRVGWMEAQGILVVIDMHQDLYGEGFYGDGAPKWTCDQKYYDAFKPAAQWFFSYNDPNMIACYDGFWNSTEAGGLQEHYVEATRRVAKKLAGSKAVVGIDPMNEPYWGSATNFEQTKLLPFYAKVIAAVRAEAPTWIAFAEPSAAHNLGLGTTIETWPFGDVAFSPHAYDSSAELGDGFDASTHDLFAEHIAAFMDEAKLQGAALWIGEYGGTPNPGYASYMDAAYTGVGMVAASQMYWSYDYNDGGYSLMKADGTEKPEGVAANVRPFPMRVAGDPISYAYDAGAKRFTMTWTNVPEITAPTEISVPARIYPAGYAVTCDGCTTEKADGALRVTKAPAGKVTLTIAAM
jgi:endoglycosylceramidase